jgi:hypothetical protein
MSIWWAFLKAVMSVWVTFQQDICSAHESMLTAYSNTESVYDAYSNTESVYDAYSVNTESVYDFCFIKFRVATCLPGKGPDCTASWWLASFRRTAGWSGFASPPSYTAAWNCRCNEFLGSDPCNQNQRLGFISMGDVGYNDGIPSKQVLFRPVYHRSHRKRPQTWLMQENIRSNHYPRRQIAGRFHSVFTVSLCKCHSHIVPNSDVHNTDDLIPILLEPCPLE